MASSIVSAASTAASTAAQVGSTVSDKYRDQPWKDITGQVGGALTGKELQQATGREGVFGPSARQAMLNSAKERAKAKVQQIAIDAIEQRLPNTLTALRNARAFGEGMSETLSNASATARETASHLHETLNTGVNQAREGLSQTAVAADELLLGHTATTVNMPNVAGLGEPTAPLQLSSLINELPPEPLLPPPPTALIPSASPAPLSALPPEPLPIEPAPLTTIEQRSQAAIQRLYQARAFAAAQEARAANQLSRQIGQEVAATSGSTEAAASTVASQVARKGGKAVLGKALGAAGLALSVGLTGMEIVETNKLRDEGQITEHEQIKRNSHSTASTVGGIIAGAVAAGTTAGAVTVETGPGAIFAAGAVFTWSLVVGLVGSLAAGGASDVAVDTFVPDSENGIPPAERKKRADALHKNQIVRGWANRVAADHYDASLSKADREFLAQTDADLLAEFQQFSATTQQSIDAHSDVIRQRMTLQLMNNPFDSLTTEDERGFLVKHNAEVQQYYDTYSQIALLVEDRETRGETAHIRQRLAELKGTQAMEDFTSFWKQTEYASPDELWNSHPAYVSPFD